MALRGAITWVLLNDPNDPNDKDFEPVLLMCSNLPASHLNMIAWFVSRWNIEVTFEESRAHLGIESQRQWSDRAVERSTPCLFGIFSLVVVIAHCLFPTALPTRSDAWYQKSAPTYADVLAAVRNHLWQHFKFVPSSNSPEMRLFPATLLDRLQSIAAYA